MGAPTPKGLGPNISIAMEQKPRSRSATVNYAAISFPLSLMRLPLAQLLMAPGAQYLISIGAKTRLRSATEIFNTITLCPLLSC